MKLYLSCMHCSPHKNGKIYNQEMEYTEEGYYHFICPEGHHNFIILQEQKYETLFQIGANAILDGYYREAVSSFTSSLERFYEFCVQVFCQKHKIDEQQVEACCKFYNNSSERQFGSFVFLYLLEFGEIPFTKKEDDKWRKFRNNVIHNGYIPKKEEALQYGDMVRKFILKTINTLQQDYSEELNILTFKILKRRGEHNKYGCANSTLSNPTILSLANGDIGNELKKDFTTRLEEMKKFDNALAFLHNLNGTHLF